MHVESNLKKKLLNVVSYNILSVFIIVSFLGDFLGDATLSKFFLENIGTSDLIITSLYKELFSDTIEGS